MDFIDKIHEISARITKQADIIQTEEATKNAFVMPFITALGYDVFDPTEVTPELCADVGTKKGEKVDYAILRDGKPIILFECKHHKTDLSKEHASQLYRYFSVTDARFGVLTNGIRYHFYADLDAPNKMDSKSFFEFDMLDIREQDVEELKRFTKAAFDLNGILTIASELKYTREIKRIMADQIQEPSDDFVRFFASQVYSGRMKQSVREQFGTITRKALKQFITDQINDRLKNALVADLEPKEEKTEEAAGLPSANGVDPSSAANGNQSKIITTEEEIDSFHIIRAILRETIPVHRIAIRDARNHCGILLDDNNRKPICRLWFKRARKYIEFFDGQKDGSKDGSKEDRVPIEHIDDIFKYADRLKSAVARYESKVAPQKAVP